MLRDPDSARNIEPKLSLHDVLQPKPPAPPKPPTVPVGALGKQVAEIVTMTQRGTLYVPKVYSPPKEVPKLQLEAAGGGGGGGGGPVAWLLGYMSPRTRAAQSSLQAGVHPGGSQSARNPPSNPLAGLAPPAHVLTARGYEWIGEESEEETRRRMHMPPPPAAAAPEVPRRPASSRCHACSRGTGCTSAAASGARPPAQSPAAAEIEAAARQWTAANLAPPKAQVSPKGSPPAPASPIQSAVSSAPAPQLRP